MLVRNLALLALMTVSTPAMAIEMFTNFQNGESLGGDPVGTYWRDPLPQQLKWWQGPQPSYPLGNRRAARYQQSQPSGYSQRATVQTVVGEEVIGEQLPSGYRVISDRAVESIDDARAKRSAVQAPSEDRLVAADRVYSNGRRGPTPAQAEAHEMIETKQTTRLQPAKSGGSVMRTKDAAPNWPKADSLLPANMEPISEQDAANW